jgi:tRNA U38,U39,U40 pseudouridine synthase TruA
MLQSEKQIVIRIAVRAFVWKLCRVMVRATVSVPAGCNDR